MSRPLTFHVVTTLYGGQEYIEPRDVDARDGARSAIADDIWSGEIEHVVRVLRVRTPDSPGALGVVTDVTTDVAKMLSARSHDEESTPHDDVRSWIIAHGEDVYETVQTGAEYALDMAIDSRIEQMRGAA